MKASLTQLRGYLLLTDGNVSGLLEDLDDALADLTSMEAELAEMQATSLPRRRRSAMPRATPCL